MITALLIGALVGLILATPPGPIAMASVNIGINKGLRSGVQLAIGTAGLDMFYSMIAIFAASAVESSVGSFFDDNPLLYLLFQIMVVVLLVLAGAIYLRKKQRNEAAALKSETPVKLSKFDSFIEGLKTKGPFLLGIALALTNIANPTFLPSLALTAAWIHKLEIFPNLFINNLIFSIGFGIGNFAWLYFLVKMVVKFRHKFNSKTITRIRQFAGLTFIGFGGIIGYRMVMFTKWPEIIRLIFAL